MVSKTNTSPQISLYFWFSSFYHHWYMKHKLRLFLTKFWVNNVTTGVKKYVSSWIWNKISSNIKTAATTSSFSHRLKKEIISKLQEWAILLISVLLLLLLLLFFFNFWKLIFFTTFLCVHTSRGTLMKIRIVLDLF